MRGWIKNFCWGFCPVLAVALFFLCASLPALSAPEPAGKSLVLAEIDGKKITARDFDAYLRLFKGSPAYQPNTLKNKRRLLGYLIDRKLLLQAAQSEGYPKRDKLKKHPSLGKVEDETMILRAYLIDHVSRKVSVAPGEIQAYRHAHPELTQSQARDAVISQHQQKRFHALMQRLRKEHRIQIYTDNLARYRKATP